jgi:hypothetical protein
MARARQSLPLATSRKGAQNRGDDSARKRQSLAGLGEERFESRQDHIVLGIRLPAPLDQPHRHRPDEDAESRKVTAQRLVEEQPSPKLLQQQYNPI